MARIMTALWLGFNMGVAPALAQPLTLGGRVLGS